MSEDTGTNLASDYAAEIAKGGLQDAATSLLGYGLSSLGIGFPDATSDALAALQSELNLIESQLVALKNEMDVVKTRIDQTEYDNRYTSLLTVTEPIHDLSSLLATVVSQKAAAPGTDFSANRTAIMQQIEDKLVADQSYISDAILGPAGGMSFYALTSTVLKDLHRFLSATDTDTVQAQVNYYQSQQFMQMLLIVQYYHALGNAVPEANNAIATYQANIGKEGVFSVNHIFPDAVVDQQSGLMIYIGEHPYVGYDSAQGILAGLNASYAGDGVGWRLPTVAELLSNDDTVGVFSGYDSKNGKVTPPQWLRNNGVPTDFTGSHFWTSIGVGEPNRRDYGKDVIGYDRAMNAWRAAGPQHYVVDSSNLGYFPASDSAQAHVIAVRSVFSWEKDPITVTPA
jgi:hypothetical protein